MCIRDRHGYIAGEHFTCPTCGKKAEVYSRITGYYRPVQNWNDGKAQEYKNRTVYDILHSGAPAEKPVETVKEERPVMGGKHPTRTMVTTVSYTHLGMSVIRCMYRKRLYFAELAGRM